jgi:penicillin-binding protein 1C
VISREAGKTIFTAAHSSQNAKTFWHLVDIYMGVTIRFHQLALDPPPGSHRITITDEKGESVTRWFTIMEN